MKISFSIIITFYENNFYLEKCLDKLNYLKKNNFDFEVILVSEIIHKLKNYNYKISFIHTPQTNNPGEKRNIAALNASNSILVFLDDDAYPLDDWLKKAYEYYKKNDMTNCLGGPGILPPDDKFEAKVSNKFYTSSLFYPFSERYKNVQKKKYKSYNDWPSVNFFVPKKIFHEVGGFNPKYWPGEDSKLCNEIIDKKYNIKYLNDLIVMHYRRSSYSKHMKQVWRYGFHRMKFFFDRDNNSKSIFFLIPLIFSIYFFTLPISLYLLTNFALLPLAAYIALLIVDIFFNYEKKDSIKIIVYSRVMILLSHLAYGLGSLNAICNKILKKNYKISLKR